MKKLILIALGVTLLTTNMNGQTKETVELKKTKKVRSYDTKKDEYQVFVGFIKGEEIRNENMRVNGLSATYYRNIADRYSVGVSLSSYMRKSNRKYECADPPDGVSTYQYFTNDMKIIMVTSKMRMNRAKRTHRFAGYMGLGAGYLLNNSIYSERSFNDETKAPEISSDMDAKSLDSFVLEAKLQFKFNITKNSGLVFENDLSFYQDRYERYSSYYDYRTGATTTKYWGVGGNTELGSFWTFKVGYFF